MIYLSGASTPGLRALLPHRSLGLMWTPAAYTDAQHVLGTLHANDNGCFTLAERFDPGVWLTWLAGMDRTGCLFAVAPDVVGDAAATLARSEPYFDHLHQLGYPVAYVLQNGQEDLPVPWADFDAVFIGGDTDWKLSGHAARLAYQAKDRGKWVHMGRVNSRKRLERAAVMGCDSADGTFLRFAPKTNLPRMLRWLHELELAPVLDLNDPPYPSIRDQSGRAA
jgi:hypothetical protein